MRAKQAIHQAGTTSRRRTRLVAALVAIVAMVLGSLTLGLAPVGTAEAARTPGELLRYDFSEGSGTTVSDTGSGLAMNLTIADPGKVTWGPDGLTLDASTQISSIGGATKLVDAVKSSGAFTVEAWVTPASGTQSGPARIVSNSVSPFSRNFLLGQGAYGNLPNDVFSLRSRTSDSIGGTPELFTPTGETSTELTHVVATRDGAGQRAIYVDGVAVSNDTLGGDTLNWNSTFPLVLGNVATGDRPWLGTLCRVAVYDAALTPTQVDDNFDAGCGVPVGPNIDPTINDVIDQNSAEGDVVSVQVTGQDDDGDTLTYSAQDLPAGLSIDESTGLIVGTLAQTAAADAPFAVQVTVDDGKGGSASDTFNWNVSAVNIDPVLPVIGTQSSSEGQNVSLVASATDVDGDQLTYSASGLPSGLNINTTTGLISGAVDVGAAAASPYSVEVTVGDGNAGTDAVSFSWTVDVLTGPAPLVNYEFDEGSGSTVADTGSGAPLDLTIADPGNVSWIVGGGLTIDSPTSILSAGSAKIDDAVTTSGAFTVEAWITSSAGEQSGPARIIENGPTPTARNFMLGQGAFGSKPDDVFSVRTRTSNTISGTPELFSATGVTSTDPTHVVAGRDTAGNRTIYVNGVLSSSDVFTGTNVNWDGSYPLVVGNTGDGTRAWLGSLCRVSVYAESLTADQVASNFADGCGGPDVPNTDPVLDTIGDQADAEGATPLVAVSATDVDATDTLAFFATGLPDGLSIDSTSGLISGTVSQTAATGSVYDVTVTVADGNGGTDAETFDWTISAVNIAPELDAIGDQATEAGQSVSLQASATDVDGDALAFSAVGLPTGLSMSTSGVVTGTVDAGIPNGTIFPTTVTVADGNGGTDAETYDWTIAANSLPFFDPQPGAQSSSEGDVVSITFDATDPDGDSLTFAAVGLPDGLSIDENTGEVSGTITQTAAAGSVYSATVTVSDGRDAPQSATFDWDVAAVNIDPQLDPIADQSNTEGESVAVGSIAADPDDDELAYSAIGLPGSVTIDPATGLISGVIDDGAAAGSPYQVEVSVTDGLSTAVQSFVWSISAISLPTPYAAYDFTTGSGNIVSDNGAGEPLDLIITDPSKVTWLEGRGLRVDESTTITTADPDDLVDTDNEDGSSDAIVNPIQASGEYTVEAWIVPGPGTQSGPARVLSNAPSPFERNLMIGQGAYGNLPDDVFSMRSRTTSAIGGTPELFSPSGSVTPGQLTHVVTTVDSTGTRTIWIDGVAVSTDFLGGTFDNWNAAYPLTIANVADGSRPWIGTFCEVNVYDAALDIDQVTSRFGTGCDLPAPEADALVQVTPNGAIGATTFGNSTITVQNTGSFGAPDIEKVEFDVRGSLIPDATFDPKGEAGDEGTQCLEVSSEGGTGYVVPDDNCNDPFSLPHEDDPGVPANGEDGMTLNFTDFTSGEAIVFGVDVDPTSIQGVPGAGGAGAVSGLELSGSTVTITFSDGQVLSNQIFGDGSAGGGQAVVAATKGVTAPTGIELVGVAATPTVFPNDSKVALVPGVGSQVIQVSGPVGSAVTLLAIEGELQSPAPFDPDPYESDTAVAVEYLTGIIGAGGTVDFPVTISNPAVLHHFVATIDDGANGPLSQKLIVAVDTPSGALIAITPGGVIDASTFTNGTMSITNTGVAGEANIASVEFDLRGSIIPDATFDPKGEAGDSVPKCLTISSGEAATGFVVPGDPCNDPFSSPHEDEPGQPGFGDDVMTMSFGDFGPGESISFAVDIDATTIQGVSGSGGAGSVSGLELTGSPITVTFDDGTTQTVSAAQLFGDGSAGGATAFVSNVPVAPAPPAIEVLSVGTIPTEFTNGSRVGSVPATGPQTVQVTAAEGETVTLLQMTGDLVTDPNFDLDDFESDTAIAVDYFTGVADATGTIDFPVDIASADVLYHFTAVVGDGGTGNSTQLVIGVNLNVNGPVIDPIADVAVDADDTIAVSISSTSPVAEAITLSIVSTPDIEVSGAVLTDNADGTGSIDWITDIADVGVYDVTVTATTASGSATTTFQIVVDDPNGGTPLYRVNAGGPEVAAADGGVAWSEDQAETGGAASGAAVFGTASANLVSGTNTTYGTADPIALTDPSVPAGTPEALFQTERFSNTTAPVTYSFDVVSGQEYEVDLYFAEIFATADGIRQFTVNIEGVDVLVDYDIHAAAGHDNGVVATFTVPVAAEPLEISFVKGSFENPKVSAIEVRTAGPPPSDVPPVIDPIAGQVATIGGSLIVPINTTEYDGDQVTLSYTSNPDATAFANLTDVGNGTGSLDFQPVAGQEGTYTIVVTATDIHGSDTEVFNLQVLEPGGQYFARINAGGPAVTAIDAGPDWEQDNTASPSQYLAEAGSGGNSGGAALEPNASVPGYVPGAVLDTERWSDSGFSYDVPVPAGTQVFVRLYLGNVYAGTSGVGQRVFDISIDEVLVENDLDLVVEYGNELAGMREYLITSDGVIDINFANVVENPLVNAIEVVSASSSPDTLGVSPAAVDFGLTLTGGSASQTVNLSNLGFDVGDPTIDVTAVTATGGDFSTDFVGPMSLVAGGSDSFDVTFAPTADGAQTGTLTITHTGVNSPVVVTLDGDASNNIPVSFSQTGLSGESSNNPTSLQFGPDGRLYVAQQDATIKAYTVQRNSATDYAVIATETIDLVKTNTPNHDDDGLANGSASRQMTGLLVTGTALNPIIFATSSDSRISVGDDSGLDTNSGVVSKLTFNGLTWDKVDIVRGLPRSEENHSTNGLALDEGTNTLYVMQGGHANKGAPGNNFSGTPEYYLSAALLSVDLDAIEGLSTFVDPRNGAEVAYDLRTLDDPTRANITNADGGFPYAIGHPLYDTSIDVGDPFGGNNSLNQAIPEPGGPVQIYSPGYRNAFDVVFTSQGRLYTSDNGPNGGWGGVPLSYDSAGSPLATGPGPYELPAGATCTNEYNQADSNGHGDTLHFISGPGYYGGHPTPIRAFPGTARVVNYIEQGNGNWVLSGGVDYDFFDLVPSDIPAGFFADNPVECDYTSNDPAKYLDVVNASTNGIAEYTASNFGGKLQGNILTASFNGNIYSYDLNAAGDSVDVETVLFSGFGSQPLDVVAQGDGDPFPGTVWAATYGADNITVFEPSDSSTCTGADDIGLDEDNDGYSNADEIDAGTDPCSGGDKPTDNDGDNVSDVNDPDDDNDGIDDIVDEFAVDPDNGLTTPIPVLRPFENNDPGTFLFGLGLTGLMTNGVDTYLEQFDPGNLAAGGNGGELGVEQVTEGDAYQGVNSQDNAFQYGVDADTTTDPFVVTTEVSATIFANTPPVNFMSTGLQVGAGDQDNYLKVVVNANGGAGGIQVLKEEAGATTATQYGAADLGGASVLAAGAGVTLSIVVDPAALTAQPRAQIDGGAVYDLGAPIAIPAAWLDPVDENGFAVGVISTSTGPGEPFDTLYAYLDVEYVAGANDAPTIDPIGAQTVAEGDTLNVPVSANDTDGDPLTYALIGAPAGMAIDASGVITWDTDLDDSGLLVVTVEVSDGVNPVVSADVDISVTQTDVGTVLRRVNAGGTAVTSIDTGPDWAANSGAVGTPPEPVEGGANVYGGNSPITDISHPTVPAGAPLAVFNSERYDVAAAPEMTWNFPATPGSLVEVRIGHGEIFSGAQTPGARIFDIEIDGVVVETGLDPFDTTGVGEGFVTDYLVNVDSDGIDVTFIHDVENPAVKWFEIIELTSAPNTAPTIDSVDPVSPVAVGANAPLPTITVTASDPEGDTISLTTDGAEPTGVSFTDLGGGVGRFTGDANDTPGTYPIVVTVSDGELSDTETLEIEIEINDAPVVTPVADQAIAENDSFSLQVDANDADSLVYSLVGAPVGMSIDGTGLITWTTDLASSGRYPITVEVTDNVNTPVATTFTLDVTQTDVGTVLRRVNAGGPLVAATDGGLDWAANGNPTTSPEPVEGGGNVYGGNSPITDISHPSVSAGAPLAIFNTERYDILAAPEMTWNFAAVPGAVVEVRMGLGEIYGPAQSPGTRVFDIEIDGVVVETALDPFAIGGIAGVGIVTDYIVTADGDGIDVTFIHGIENPSVKWFEIIEVVPSTNAAPAFDAALADATTAENVAYSFTPAVTDPESDALTYSLEGDVPAGMTIDGATGQIDWTPDYDGSGRYDITVSVTDGFHAPVSDSYTLDVGQTAPPGSALFRVNAGGASVAAADNSFPDWGGDTGAVGSVTASPYLVGAGNTAAGAVNDTTHPTVPGTAPDSVFTSERWGASMAYAFPVDVGTEVEVRVLLNETYGPAMNPGVREFGINIDGAAVADSVEPYAEAGNGGNVASVVDFVVVSDGVVDITFTQIADNPAIKGIEILGVSGVPGVAFLDSLDGATITTDSVAVEWLFNGFNDPTNDHVHFTIDGGPATNPPNDDTINLGNTHNTIYRPDTSILLENLADGQHTVTVAVADTSHAEYANAEAFATATFTVALPAGPITTRINSGGPTVAAIDAGPDWAADEATAHSTLTVSSGSSLGAWPVDGLDSSVPVYGQINDLFVAERWDGTDGAAPDVMTYEIPVSQPGALATVNLFMMSGWDGASAVGQRQFDVSIEGVLVLDDFDPVAAYNHRIGGVETFSSTDDGDGVITIVFDHGPVQNPQVNAIEVIG